MRYPKAALKVDFVIDGWLSVQTKVIALVSWLPQEKATILVRGLSRIRTWARVNFCRLPRVRKQVATLPSFLDSGHDIVIVIIRKGSGNGQHGVIIVRVRHQMRDRGIKALPRTTVEREENTRWEEDG